MIVSDIAGRAQRYRKLIAARTIRKASACKLIFKQCMPRAHGITEWGGGKGEGDERTFSVEPPTVCEATQTNLSPATCI